MSDRPAYGTAPIKCGKRGCDWRGFETDLVKKPAPHPTAPMRISVSQNVCPKCGNDSYVFIKAKK